MHGKQVLSTSELQPQPNVFFIFLIFVFFCLFHVCACICVWFWGADIQPGALVLYHWAIILANKYFHLLVGSGGRKGGLFQLSRFLAQA